MATDVRVLICAGALLLAALGCDEKKEPKAAPTADAGPSRAAAVDPKLAEAVAKAGTKGPKTAASAPDGDGPPQSGVFEAGKADQQLKRGDPPKVAIGDAGSAPRVSLAASFAQGFKQTGSVELALKSAQGATPAIAVELSVEATKPKPAPAAAGADPAAAPAPVPEGGPTPMVAKVTNAKFATELGAAAKDLTAMLGRLRGSRIDYRVVEGGVGVDFQYQLAKTADPELDNVLRAVAEALEASTLGFPKDPVGSGATWLVTTRGMFSGVDVVSYRMVKLEKLDGDVLSLSVATKRYAASTKISLAGVPPGAELEQFQSSSESTLTGRKGSPLATGGSLKQIFAAQLVPAAQRDQRMRVQSLAETTISFEKK